MPADRVPSRIDPTILLSRRQVEVVYLLTLGLSVKEAAHRLGASYHTTCAHLRLAMRRLEVHNRAELLRAAAAHGFVSPPPGSAGPSAASLTVHPFPSAEHPMG